MLGVGDGFYIRISDESDRRLLHPAKIVGAKGNDYTAELENVDAALEEGQSILIYYEDSSGFVQQAALIDTVTIGESKPTLEFKTTSEPVPAERRQSFRVSAVMCNLEATLDTDEGCPLLDVSATGFSVLADHDRSLGNVVEVILRYDGRRYTGDACILSKRELKNGRMRYGLYGLADKKSGGNLQAGLRHITMAIQRQHLQRQARTV